MSADLKPDDTFHYETDCGYQNTMVVKSVQPRKSDVLIETTRGGHFSIEPGLSQPIGRGSKLNAVTSEGRYLYNIATISLCRINDAWIG